ncbi:TetR/AcrR family transcriptional regulator [Puerhibacterium puerhi]|uniref:TetR/AcrR family transcriptional regulator n=1 Tax=Puerhibacterium puerhi TaxID=2692623 RepID=UPI0013577717|nr:TetR/AcrR family transcriptional regulator [Puerhibacterium puerhi]
MTTATPGLRERQKQARADAIVDAAQRLVLAHGLDAVTVEAIAEEAGVSPRTFFNYFDTKDAAVLGHRELDLDAAVTAAFVAGGPTGQFLPDLEVLLLALVEGATEHPERGERAFRVMAAEPRLVARHLGWLEEHRAQVETLLAQRHLARPLPAGPTFCSHLVLTLVRATGERWDAAGRGRDIAVHVHAAVEDLAAVAGS